MAEFQVVMREVRRMCREHGSTCIGCPISNFQLFGNSLCKLKEGIYGEADFEKIEAAVMKWANEHPEPRYPTWREWREANFPESPRPICPLNFMNREEACGEPKSCGECLDNPITADIAEKLGIKPIGVSSDA